MTNLDLATMKTIKNKLYGSFTWFYNMTEISVAGVETFVFIEAVSNIVNNHFFIIRICFSNRKQNIIWY